MNNLKEFSKIRIVWNLTNNCPFNCPMCVTSANLREEKNINKELLLKSILSIPKELLNIDFSGGDPLWLDENYDIVKKASNILGRDNISISSTGLSLAKLSDQELISLSQNYDMTYDFSIKYNEYDIRDKRYNLINYQQSMRLLNLGLNVDIMFPVRNIPFNYYDELAKDLCKLNPNSIKLLKCMPLNEKFDTNNIDSVKYTNYLMFALRKYGYDKKISVSCAMKEDYDYPNCCNMLSDRKIGLDQFGNLFTCIWASDLLVDREINPFYLGNLFDNTLLDILNSKNIKDMKNDYQDDRDKCHVLSYYYQKNKKR